ncbi:MAG: hypothetical protein JSW58_04450 [Candidatus Latescibacterota bacterium]|nr:MAG: hypothetical protein JSW58_04450 [Candidatus Latescibacterota bacterium]
MRTKCRAILLLVITMVVSGASAGLGQELDEHLRMLKRLTGATWVGHFVNSSDSELTHVIRWEPILNGNAIRSTKDVAALDFKMETLYFWDWENETISFLRLTSRGIFSRGTVVLEDDRITLLGTGVTSKGVSEFKQTFEIRSEGTLQDCFYRRDNGQWLQGHLIEYTRQEGNTKRN